MTAAISQSESLAYIAETVWGTTPATPVMQRVRYTGIGSGGTEKTTTESAEVSTARSTSDIIQTAKRGAFSVNFELSYAAQFEAWLEGLLGGAFATNVLQVGTTRKSFTFERQFMDISQYLLYTGAMPAKLSIASGIGNVINGSAEFRSKFPTLSAASAASSNTAVGTNPVMDPISSIQLIQEGGAGSVAGPTEFSMELENGIIDLPQLASADPLDLRLGELRAKGRFSLYFQDATYWAKFANHTTTSLAFTLGGAASLSYAFLFNKVKLTAVDLPNAGKNTPIIQTFEWQAFHDATTTLCQVTRDAA